MAALVARSDAAPNAAEPERLERIAALRRRLAFGEYEVDPQRIAEAILRSGL